MRAAIDARASCKCRANTDNLRRGESEERGSWEKPRRRRHRKACSSPRGTPLRRRPPVESEDSGLRDCGNCRRSRAGKRRGAEARRTGNGVLGDYPRDVRERLPRNHVPGAGVCLTRDITRHEIVDSCRRGVAAALRCRSDSLLALTIVWIVGDRRQGCGESSSRPRVPCAPAFPKPPGFRAISGPLAPAKPPGPVLATNLPETARTTAPRRRGRPGGRETVRLAAADWTLRRRRNRPAPLTPAAPSGRRAGAGRNGGGKWKSPARRRVFDCSACRHRRCARST